MRQATQGIGSAGYLLLAILLGVALACGGCGAEGDNAAAADAPLIIASYAGASEVLQASGGSITVEGVVTNTGDDPVEDVAVQVTFYASENQVASTKTVPLADSPLPAGHSASFRLYADWQPEIVAFSVALLDDDGVLITETPWRGLH